MTVKQYTDKIKFVKNQHPNEKMYSGRTSIETSMAVNQALECLTSDQFSDLYKKTLIHDEDETAELFDEIQVDDIIGLCAMEPGIGWVPDQWRVTGILAGDDKILVVNRHDELVSREIFFEDLSIGLVLGRAEILRRNDKPYGFTDEELTTTIEIVDMSAKKSKTEDAEEDSTAPVPAVEAKQEEIPDVQDSAQGDSSTADS